MPDVIAMEAPILENIVYLLAFGVGAQWLAWRFRVPSILMLLCVGFLAGPVFRILDPDQMLGDALMPLVSLSVGIIMFEGGLSLNFREWNQIGSVVRGLLWIGAFTTWTLATLAAHFILGWDWPLSILLGSILVVTGPTVILPLLRHVRPSPTVGNILKWEGILIDPIGALLALLVFEAIIHNLQFSEFGIQAVKALGMTFFVGLGLGGVGAGILVWLLRRHHIPEFLDNSFTLMSVALVFTISNHWQHESGLLAVTIMGIVLTNQKWIDVGHIVDFKENLRTLLIASLFILLSSRLTFEQLNQLNWGQGVLFLLALLIFVRPLSVLVATTFSPLKWKEKAFLAWMAPRGIVAAAVASFFALRLEEAGVVGAEQLVPATFLVIVGTVLIYGLTSQPFARFLGLAQPDPQGFLLLGATPFSVALAEALQRENIVVLLIDTNRDHLKLPRLNGIPTWHGNLLRNIPDEIIDLQGLGNLLALTPNDEVNTLAALQMKAYFGKDHIFQLHPMRAKATASDASPKHLTGKYLLSPEFTCSHLNHLIQLPDRIIKATTLTEEFTFTHFTEQFPNSIPLILKKNDQSVHVWDPIHPQKTDVNSTLIHLAQT